MHLMENEYKSKVMGCWMGKNIGGTFGAPYEWLRQVNDTEFYAQDMSGGPLPNDDLDIQLAWLVAMEDKGVDIDAKLLGEYWMLLVTPHWAEYGVAKLNMRSGLVPPLSGTVNNAYKNSCGAFIRSEIWACAAPGHPALAAKFAFEDAILDHGDGEGVYAEVFCAALQSAAFSQGDLTRLVDIGLSYIPRDCAIARAVATARASYAAGKPWREARDDMLREHRGYGMTVCPEDEAKGFKDGDFGWDAPSNIGIIILGMLYGEGDFSDSMRIIVNCGEDTDCTAATYGAVYGIIHGIDGIPEEWKAPVGHKIVTACLNLGELGGYGSQLPQTIDELTERTGRIMRQVLLRNGLPPIEEALPEDLFAPKGFERLYDNMRGTVSRFTSFETRVEYPDGPVLRDGVPAKLRVAVKNIGKTSEMYTLRWIAPEQFHISPGREGKSFIPLPLGPCSGENTHEFTVTTESVPAAVNRMAIELVCENKGTTMLSPVVFLNATGSALS